MSDLNLILVVVSFIGSIIVGLFTLLKNPRSWTNVFFFIFVLIIAVYLPVNYMISHQATAEGSFFWVKMVISIAVLMNVSFFLLAKTFPNVKIQINSKQLFFPTIFSLTVLVLIHLNQVFESAEAYGKTGDPGKAMPLFLLHTAILLGWGFWDLVRKYTKTRGLQKIQIRLFLFSTVVLFLSILLTNLLFVLLLNTGEFISLLPVYTLVFTSVISYAIVRHRFLDIRLVVIRAIASLLTLIILGAIFSGVVFIILHYAFGVPLSPNLFIIFISGSLTVGFLRTPLGGFFEKVTSRIFFRDQYDETTFLAKLSKIMAETLTLSDLSHNVLSVLIDEMKISGANLVVFDSGDLSWLHGEGKEIAEGKTINKRELTKLISTIVEKPGEDLLVFEEMEESEGKNIMRNHSITVILALVVKKKPVGALIMGEKSSGTIYSTQDIDVLNIIAPELAVAVKNALSYEEIKRFNITLEDEVKAATAHLRSANRRLRELDKLKDEFVSLASHELRTPMTVIRSYVDMLLNEKNTGKLSEKQKDYLERVYSSSNRLSNLVNEMLDISRIESGRITLNRKEFQIDNTIKEIIIEMQTRANEQGIELSMKTDIKKGLKITADEERIKEVLINFIGNGLKYNTEGGKVTVVLTQKGNEVIVEVRDTGIGISKENLPKLFKKFTTFAREYSESHNIQSTGLGLYLSKSIIELHEGKVWAESEGEGKGASFFFSLGIK